MLKSTGIVRRLDDLGRLVIPIELRRTLSIENRDAIEIFTEGDSVILRRYAPLCLFCGTGGELVLHRGKRICRNCCSTLGAAPSAATEVMV